MRWVGGCWECAGWLLGVQACAGMCRHWSVDGHCCVAMPRLPSALPLTLTRAHSLILNAAQVLAGSRPTQSHSLIHSLTHSLSLNAAQVPAGSLPRTMEVILRNDQVETVRPGDKACFTGMLVVVPDVAALT